MKMKSILAPIGLGGILLFASAGAGHAQTYSLAQLIAGQTFNIADNDGDSLIFRDFGGYVPVATGGAIAPTAAQIFATAINIGTANPGLLWSSALWNVNAVETMDTAWHYNVVTSDGVPDIDDADMTILSFDAHNGADIHITDSITDSASGLLANLSVDATLPRLTEHAIFRPVNFLHVEKDVALEAVTPNSDASLSTFTQTFSTTTVPEGSSLPLLGMGMLSIGGIGVFNRRAKAAKSAK